MYDILNIKLRVFYNYCTKIGLSDTQYHNAFSVMLKGRAATFYYDNLSGKGYGFVTTPTYQVIAASGKEVVQG
jgi:hypothetical protein